MAAWPQLWTLPAQEPENKICSKLRWSFESLPRKRTTHSSPVKPVSWPPFPSRGGDRHSHLCPPLRKEEGRTEQESKLSRLLPRSETTVQVNTTETSTLANLDGLCEAQVNWNTAEEKLNSYKRSWSSMFRKVSKAWKLLTHSDPSSSGVPTCPPPLVSFSNHAALPSPSASNALHAHILQLPPMFGLLREAPSSSGPHCDTFHALVSRRLRPWQVIKTKSN